MITPLYNHLAAQVRKPRSGQFKFIEPPPGEGAAYLERHQMTPHAAFHVLSRDLPGDIDITLKYEWNDQRRLRISLFSLGREKEGIFEASRTLDITNRSSPSGQIDVDPSCQGQNIGKTIMRNQIELAGLLGAEKFEISCIDSGAYSWAKMGFVPKDSCKNELRDMVDHRLAAFFDILPGNILERIERLSEFKNTNDLVRLSEMDYNLSEAVRQVRSILEQGPGTSASEDYSWAENVWGFLGAHFEAASAQNKPLTLGRALLVDTMWNGILDLQCSDSMQRIADYSGGFKYLEIAP